MAKANINRALEGMLKAANADYARGIIDKAPQLVTVTKTNLINAFKDAYYNGVGKQRKLPNLDDFVFEDAADAALTALITYVERPRTLAYLRKKVEGRYVKFSQPRAVLTPFSRIKNAGVRSINKSLASKKVKQIDKDESIFFKQRIQRLHGQATIGARQALDFSVGSGQLATALNYLESTKNLAGFVNSREAKKLQDKFNLELFFITSGRGQRTKLALKEGIEIGITVKSSSENPAGAESTDWAQVYPELEKSIFKWAQKQDFYRLPGSNSMEEDHVDIVADVVMKTLTNSKSIRGTKTQRPTRRNKKETLSKRGGRKSADASKKRAKTPRVSKAKDSNVSLVKLIGILNQKLPEVVAANMQSPRLNYQTGRFASSVKVTDISTTGGGFPSIGYTYQKDPYQVFEVGAGRSPWANVDRDPRKLIDTSIREIAAQMAIGRFYTRRV